MSNKSLSNLSLREQELTGNDLMLVSQLTAAGWKSAQVTLEDFFVEMFRPTNSAGQLIQNIQNELTTLENRFDLHENPALNTTDPNYDPHAGFYLRQVTKLASNSGLIGDGRSSNPMSVNFSYLDTLYVNETDFTNYQGNVNTQINNINNTISQGAVPNTRKVNTGAGLVGGGDLSADRTISMGAPSSITSGSSNSASGDTHSHELAPGAVTNAKLANNSVTDEKIQSVSASKITGVIPSGNLPPAAATINVVDNLTSNSVNDALSANQGRILAEQLVTNAKLADGAVSTSKIADGAVDTNKINNGAVTDAKIVSMSANKLTGVVPSANLPPASAPVNVIDNLTSNSVNDALSANQGRILAGQVVGTSKIADGAVTNAKLADGAVTNAKIADGAVTNSKIVSVDYSKITNTPTQGVATPVVDNLTSVSTTSALSANQGRILSQQLVTNAKLADGAVSTSKIADGAVDTNNIAAGAVINANIGNGSVDTSKLADSAVTNVKIADGAVDTIKINNGAVTDAKIVSMSADKLTGVIPSANLPPASAPVNVVDNLTSNSVNDALSANQGRILSQQIASKFNSTGGTLTGDLSVTGILQLYNPIIIDHDSIRTTISHDEYGFSNTSRTKFATENERFFFDKDVYFGSVQKAANGYTTLPNGLIMQWGRGQINNDGDVIFPIAFPNSLVNVQVTDEGAGSASHGYNWSLSDNTKFRCTSQGGGAFSYSYVALGY